MAWYDVLALLGVAGLTKLWLQILHITASLLATLWSHLCHYRMNSRIFLQGYVLTHKFAENAEHRYHFALTQHYN